MNRRLLIVGAGGFAREVAWLVDDINRANPTWELVGFLDRQPGAPIRGLPAVSLALPADLHPLAVWTFLREPTTDLAVGDQATSPLDWLRSGGSPDPVAAIAREL